MWALFLLLLSFASAFGPHHRLPHNARNDLPTRTVVLYLGDLTKDDVERYRNRATLTERLLQQKIADLELVQAKLILLQNVVLKLKEEGQKTKEMMSDEQSQEELKITLNQTRLEREALQDELVKVKEVHKLNLQELQNELSQTKEQRNQLNRTLMSVQDEVILLQKKLGLEKKQARQRQEEEASTIKSLNQQLSALTLEKNVLVDELANVTRSLQDSQRQSAATLASLEQTLSNVTNDRDALQQQLETIKVSHEESLEIASASVKAAERREAATKKELDRVLSETRLLKEEAEKLLLASKDETMQQEIDELNEQIRALKLTHTAQLNAEKKRAKQELADLEDYYELFYQDKLEEIRQQNVQLRQVVTRPSRARRILQRVLYPFR